MPRGKRCGALGAGVNEGLGPCQLPADHHDSRHQDAEGRSFITFRRGTAAGAKKGSVRKGEP